MPLESASYIDGLNTANPGSSDYMNQADDHIRMIKAVLKNTFPNITGAVTKTQEAINNGVVPVGGIIKWCGAADAVPTGWKLCDGGTYAKMDGSGNITLPDLRNKFVIGCGGSNSVPLATPSIGATGGQTSVTPTITVTNEAVALTQAQLPNCNFTVTDAGHNHTASVTDPGHTHGLPAPGSSGGTAALFNGVVVSNYTQQSESKTTGISVSIANNTTGISVASGGSGSTHIHNNTASSSAVSTMPPYYTLAFICRI